jgi:hypothetical protein|tara:strand:- start:365 stop:523 length:159 start_codon:yes stop_codon:yes gene_type:complete
MNDGATKKAIILCGVDCVLSDPDFKEYEALPPGESYTLPKLIKHADEDEGDC